MFISKKKHNDIIAKNHDTHLLLIAQLEKTINNKQQLLDIAEEDIAVLVESKAALKEENSILKKKIQSITNVVLSINDVDWDDDKESDR